MRNPNGYGSVYKLSGKRRKPWTARVTIGWKADTAKKKLQPVYKFLGYFEKQKEAIEALVEYNKDPYDLSKGDYTLEEVYNMFMQEAEKERSKNTTRMYKSGFNAFKKIKDKRLNEIDFSMLQTCIDESDLSKGVLSYGISVITQTIRLAYSKKIINNDLKNRVEFLKCPDKKVKKNPREILTEKDIELLWEHKDEKYVKMLLLLLYTGLRIEELLTLKKDNVNLKERCIYVTKSKTEAGLREVPIAEKIIPILKKCINENEIYLFQNLENANKIAYITALKKIKKTTLELLGVEHKPHDTRHTIVSILTKKDVPQYIIQKIVGHKDGSVTRDVYTHVSLKEKLDAVNKL